jgi:hypothetical protein
MRHDVATYAWQLPVTSRAIDDRADQLEPVLRAPDVARREAGQELRDRLTELAGAHPSSAGYASGQRMEGQPDSRDRPAGQEQVVDSAHADRVKGPEPVWPSEIVVPADRRAHILEGEPGDGGGHRHGTGQPDKTEFPAAWNDDRIIDAVLAVVRNPDQPPERQDWNERWQVGGIHDGVGIVAVVERDGRVWTAWPLDGSPGVVRNPVGETDGRP